MRIAWISIVCGVMMTLNAAASPLVYQREKLVIISEVEVPIPTKATDKEEAQDTAKKPKKVKMKKEERQHLFSITVERANSVKKEWMMQLSAIRGNKAILYLFDEPSIATISPSTSTQANDLLFINSYGMITTIAKNIAPANLAEPMQITTPAKAMLYIEAGLADRLQLKPQDKIEYSAFPKPPSFTGDATITQ
jgi:uncharacterized membrane protein (UPF0127 family)